jgi:hypothetical protein
MIDPAETLISCPLIMAASSEHKKATAAPIYLGSTKLDRETSLVKQGGDLTHLVPVAGGQHDFLHTGSSIELADQFFLKSGQSLDSLPAERQEFILKFYCLENSFCFKKREMGENQDLKTGNL